MKHILLAFALGALVACEPVATPQQPPSEQPQVAMKRFTGKPAPIRATRSNTDIAAEFLDFHFELESGRKIPTFSRFEGPITVAYSTPQNAVANTELRALVARLRSEAGISISMTSAGSPANILINRITRRQLNSVVRGAACFVVPNIQEIDGIRARNAQSIDWARVRQRTKAGIFIPTDISAQELRDCLHEEVAQALGPLNDLYRVQETIFNDDNMQRVLSSYDMMILRTTYSPALRSGMSRSAVAARLPSILARTNPGSSGYATQNLPKSSAQWKGDIDRGIFSAGGNRSALNRAISTAEANRYGAPRIALGYFSRGHLNGSNNRDAAVADFSKAYNLYSNSLGPRSIQAARAGIQLASVALSQGKVAEAENLTNAALSTARNHHDAGLMFSLLGLKAVIASARGDDAGANSLVAESQGWAAYAIGVGKDFVRYYTALQKRIDQVGKQS